PRRRVRSPRGIRERHHARPPSILRRRALGQARGDRPLESGAVRAWVHDADARGARGARLSRPPQSGARDLQPLQSQRCRRAAGFLPGREPLGPEAPELARLEPRGARLAPEVPPELTAEAAAERAAAPAPPS